MQQNAIEPAEDALTPKQDRALVHPLIVRDKREE